MMNPFEKPPELDLTDIAKKRFNFSKEAEIEKIQKEQEILAKEISILEEL